jgi:hypothetical protein
VKIFTSVPKRQEDSGGKLRKGLSQGLVQQRDTGIVKKFSQVGIQRTTNFKLLIAKNYGS